MSVLADRLWNIWLFNSCEYLPFHKLESIWSFPQSHSTLRSNIKTSKVVCVIQILFSCISIHVSYILHRPSISSASCSLFHPYIKCTPWFHWLQDSCYIRFHTLLKSSPDFHCLKNNFNCSVCFELHTQLTLFCVPAGYSPCLSLISQSFPLLRYLNENFLGMCHIVSKFPQCIYFVLLSYIWLPCALITNFQIILFVFYQICFY